MRSGIVNLVFANRFSVLDDDHTWYLSQPSQPLVVKKNQSRVKFSNGRDFTQGVDFYTQIVILHTEFNYTHRVWFYTQCMILQASLRCFVARQLLYRIYALSSVKFSGLKLWLRNINDKYQLWLQMMTVHWSRVIPSDCCNSRYFTDIFYVWSWI